MAHQGRLIAAPIRLAMGGLLALVLLGTCLPAGARAETFGSISGKVTEATSHEPLAGIEVCAFSTNLELLEEAQAEHAGGCQKTGPAGEYTIGELQPESYIVEFLAPLGSSSNFIPQIYEAKQRESEATPVEVKAGTTTPEIDAELSPGAEISGTVTGAATGTPVNEALICAAREEPGGSFVFYGCAESEANGSYMVRGLPSGEYKLVYFAAGFATGWYQGKATRAEAQLVSVVAPNLTLVGDEALAVGSALKLPGSSTPTEAGSGSPLPGKSTTPATGTLTVQARRLTVGPHGETTLRLTCSGSAACRGKVTLSLQRTVRIKGRKVRRAVTIGTSAVLAIAAGRHGTAKIRLDAKARSMLRADHGRLKVEMTLLTTGHMRVRRSLQLVERAQAGS